MIIKPEYTKYSKRLSWGISRVILVAAIWTVFIFFNDIGRTGHLIVLSVLGTLTLLLIISVLKKSKNYIGEIKIGEEECEFIVHKFDKQKDKIKTKTSETRIKIWELFFPFTRFGRNYKLVIETKAGITYKPIIQQYEIGNWNLDKFKEVMRLYGEIKGIPISTKSFSRDNFSIYGENRNELNT